MEIIVELAKIVVEEVEVDQELLEALPEEKVVTVEHFLSFLVQ